MAKKVFFLGSKQLGLITLQTLYVSSPNTLSRIITIDDSKDERSNLSEFKQFAEDKQVPIYVLKKPSELSDLINREKPDMVVVVGWYWIIDDDLLDKVPDGIIGIHASLLPKYRGFAPLVWAIINGEKKTGISLFYFERGIDTGDIVAQKEFEILENDTIKELLEKTEKSIINVLNENYSKLLVNEAPRIKQNHEYATYCSQRKPENGKLTGISIIKKYMILLERKHPLTREHSRSLKIKKLRLLNHDYFLIPI